MFLDCLTFRMGLYSSHFGEVRRGIENDLAEAAKRDPLIRLGDWLIGTGMASTDDLERLQRDEEQRVEAAFETVRSEIDKEIRSSDPKLLTPDAFTPYF